MLSTALTASAQDAVAEYESILQQIADREVSIAQREFYLQQQAEQIASLQERIRQNQDGDVKGELLPVVRTMVEELEKVMVEDLPFQVERRFALLDQLREDLRSDDVLVSDAYRRAMELYGSEVERGLSVASYVGNNPVNPGQRFAACQQDPESAKCDLSKEQVANIARGATVEDFNDLGQLPDGNYIHYGRMALLYLERDSSEGYRYDADAKEWQRVPNSELLTLRQNVRIARGESAIATMVAPIQIGEAAGEAS